MCVLRYVASDHVRFHHDLKLPPREIDHYRFLYVESGQGEFRISGHHFEVAAGWLGLLSPGLRENRYYGTEAVSYLFVEFASSKILVDRCATVFQHGDPQRSALIGLLKSIDSCRHDRDGCLLSAAVRLMFLVDEPTIDPPLAPRLAEAIRMIQRHPDRNYTVSELAIAVKVSEAHLRRLFRTHLQISPKQYLLHNRMQFAQRLLRFEGLRVGEVARLLGFETVFQFSAQYRRVMGRPPSTDRTPE